MYAEVLRAGETTNVPSTACAAQSRHPVHPFAPPCFATKKRTNPRNYCIGQETLFSRNSCYHCKPLLHYSRRASTLELSFNHILSANLRHGSALEAFQRHSCWSLHNVVFASSANVELLPSKCRIFRNAPRRATTAASLADLARRSLY
jgi:hypothetical protein